MNARFLQSPVPALIVITGVLFMSVDARGPYRALWIGIPICAVMGAAMLVRPQTGPDVRPAFVRALGVTMLAVALFGAWHLAGLAGASGGVQ